MSLVFPIVPSESLFDNAGATPKTPPGLRHQVVLSRTRRAIQRPIQVIAGSNEREMGKCLWKVPKRLTHHADLLRIQADGVCIGQHLFEQQPRVGDDRVSPVGDLPE
jgi:hypothetical protein